MNYSIMHQPFPELFASISNAAYIYMFVYRNELLVHEFNRFVRETKHELNKTRGASISLDNNGEERILIFFFFFIHPFINELPTR